MQHQNKSKFSPARRYLKTLFLSDIHFGTRGCQIAKLIDFLNHHEAQTIYLVGDVFDTLHPLGSNVTSAHHEAIKILTDRAKRGTRVIYIPGNHDSFFRKHIGQSFFGFDIQSQATHVLPDGRRFLVVHGDECDPISVNFPLFESFASKIEALVRTIEFTISYFCELFFRKRFTLLQKYIHRVSNIFHSKEQYRNRLLALAKKSGHEGVICGHFHEAAFEAHDDMIYANCGDWIDNCSALVEGFDGDLALVKWQAEKAQEYGFDAALVPA